MQVPTIHLNGTTAQSLVEDIMTAGNAIFTAMQKLEATAPNLRDYYPQPQENWIAAQREHCDRYNRLRDVRAELLALAEAIDSGGFKRDWSHVAGRGGAA